MSEIYRFGISLEKQLINSFDRLIKEKNYTNRSEAIRDLIRQELVKKEWEKNNNIAGAITLIYDHHREGLTNSLLDIQHNFRKLIISSQHIHIDCDNCLEIIAIKGESKEALELANMIKSLKGIKHVTLSMSSTGEHID